MVTKALSDAAEEETTPSQSMDDADGERGQQPQQVKRSKDVSIASFLRPYFGAVIQWPKLRSAIQPLAQGNITYSYHRLYAFA